MAMFVPSNGVFRRYGGGRRDAMIWLSGLVGKETLNRVAIEEGEVCRSLIMWYLCRYASTFEDLSMYLYDK